MTDKMHDEKRNSNEDIGFRVVDRRLFTAEGELRPEAVQQKQAEQTATAQPSRTEPESRPATSPAAQEREPPRSSPSFQLLIDFLARNAAVLLGGYADPRTGQAIVDLDGARELLDMLDALREKTRGNLTAEEERLLTDVLGSLKLSYVEVSQAASKAMKQKVRGQS
ncbi:MAG: DUF1844 domain-containing protein [Acidobacteriia bacterium]|jgi:hypothetical protein|nr:DUF1844 domain-containing protein [Terriglobia bacterium]